MNVAEGSIVPVLMGSNILARGIYTLLVDIVKYLPSPEKRTCTGINAKTNEGFTMRITNSQSKIRLYLENNRRSFYWKIFPY